MKYDPPARIGGIKPFLVMDILHRAHQLGAAGGRPILVPAGTDEGFSLRVDAVQERITTKTRAILINSPANPTGFRLTEEEIRKLAGLDVFLVSDEICHGLNYGGPDHSALEFSDDALIINGFSKYFAMTGWRLGCLILLDRFMRQIEVLQQNFFVSPNPFVQRGSVAALREGISEAERMRNIYAERRKVMLDMLRRNDFPIHREPDGAFYVLADARAYGPDSLLLAREILEATGVAVAPEADFGPGGEGFLRFSYCNSIENIEKGVEGVGKYPSNR